ncbi:MAG: metallophosphoesterase [Alphaproteobacteria bacterium]|nr:metallophosphoesterase [Alphaproteobacteria bacterium]
MRVAHLDPQPFHVMGYHSSTSPRGLLSLPFLRGRIREPSLSSWASVVVLSDLQGREDRDGAPGRLLGEAVAEELTLLAGLGEIADPKASLCLICGDLYDYPDLRKKGGSGPVDAVWQALAGVFGQVLGVLGNHDHLERRPPAENARALDGELVEAGGLRVVGVDGIIGKASKPRRRPEAEFLAALDRALGAKPDLLLLHEGPAHPEFGHGLGSGAVRSRLRHTRDGGLLCFGHCHWDEPMVELGGWQALNVDGRVVVLT